MKIRPTASRLHIQRIVRCEDGAVAPLIGLIMLVLIGCMGFAIDIGRSVLVRARLADALDAAGLAVGARLSTSDFSAEAKKFVDANFKASYSGATVTSVTAVGNASNTVISLTASATMPTVFMKLFGTNTVKVNATSEVTRSSAGLELVMALDNTGSMSGDMADLKSAAHLLVNTVFGGQTVGKNLYVGLVPFSQAVNVGYPMHKAWFDADHAKTQVPPDYQAYWPAYSKGCAEARQGGLDQTDEPPVQSKKSSLLHYYLNPPPDNADQQKLNAYFANEDWGKGCPQVLLPMTSTKKKVDDAIDTMAADGNTHVNLGAVWAWRMLSPRWRTYWAGDMAASALPLDYNTKNMTKAAVIMTDGENTKDETYSAYGKLSEGRLGTTNASAAVTALNTRLTKVCTDMKTAGVLVYTVAFRNPGATIKSLLQNCASNTDFYFDSSTKDKLKTDFQTIGDSLSNLRVSR